MGWLRLTGVRRGVGLVAGIVLLLTGCAEQTFEERYQKGRIDVPDDLYAATAVGKNHFWASGYFGALYRTTDGGETWNKLDGGTSKPIYAISFADEKTGWAVGQHGFVIHTTDGGDTWERQFVPRKPYRHLFGIHAIDTQNVWAVSDWGGLYSTADGGKTWVDHSFTVDEKHPTFQYLSEADHAAYYRGEPVYDDVYLNDIYFTDKDHGWIAAEYGMIFRTEDGGQTWEKGKIVGDVDFDEVPFDSENSKISRDLWDMLFGASEVLMARPYLRVRIEGFLTPREFAQRGDTFLADERAENVRDFLEGEGVGQDRVRILNPTPFDEESVDMNEFRKKKTRERSFARMQVIETPFLFDVKFKDNQNGMIAGLGGVILMTDDGGRNWRYAETDSKFAFFAAAFGASQLVAVGERGQQRRSSDGGQTWERYGSDFPEVFSYMRDLVFGDPEQGWVIGGDGLVLRTTDGGQSWEQVLPEKPALAAAAGE